MELKQNVEASEMVKKLRERARKLHDEGVLHDTAWLMQEAADMIADYIRKDLERG